MIIAMDFGATYLKYVVSKNNKIIKKNMVDILDINTKEGLEKIVSDIIFKEKIQTLNIKLFKVTGAKASFLGKTLLGKKIEVVDEFKAIAKGLHKEIKIRKFVVISCGTGTSILYVNNSKVTHLGGTGLGGGTIKGLLLEDDMDKILNSAKDGDLDNTDILIKDISKNNISNLNKDVTCSNLGAFNSFLKNNKLKNDNKVLSNLSLGVLNLVYQNIGVCAALASNIVKTKNVVFIGNAVNNIYAKIFLRVVEKLYKKKFYFVKESGYIAVKGCL